MYVVISFIITLHYSVRLNKSVYRCTFLINSSLVSIWVLKVLLVTSVIYIYWSSEKSINVLFCDRWVFIASDNYWVLISFDCSIYHWLAFSILLVWWNIFYIIFLIKYLRIWSWLIFLLIIFFTITSMWILIIIYIDSTGDCCFKTLVTDNTLPLKLSLLGLSPRSIFVFINDIFLFDYYFFRLPIPLISTENSFKIVPASSLKRIPIFCITFF